MNKIGVMQGRLSKPIYPGTIQAFPYDTWEEEFFKASDIGLDYIEGIYDRTFINFEASFSIINKTGISLSCMCADFVIGNLSKHTVSFFIELLVHMMNQSERLGCSIVTLPFVNIAYTKFNIDRIVAILDGLEHKSSSNFKIGLEVDEISGFLVKELSQCFLNKIYGGFTYDIGNLCLDLHVEHIKENLLYLHDNKMLNHIHIKEKNNNGVTVPLGTGKIGKGGWKEIFKCLKYIGYKGNYTLQVAREKEGDEFTTVKRQFEFVKNLL